MRSFLPFLPSEVEGHASGAACAASPSTLLGTNGGGGRCPKFSSRLRAGLGKGVSFAFGRDIRGHVLPRPLPLRGRGVLVALGVKMALLSPAVSAQTLVTSDRPENVSVTLYRAPDRSPDSPIDTASAQGFALITETRTVTLPVGPAVIRFEGVAGNIMPESAIVTGLPQDVAEKNLDADLLSPRTLYDRALGRRVMIRRTDKATGRVTEQQATIRSSADGAAVLEVAGGYEALRCSGLPETIVHPSIPDGLSARPTLSIATTASRPVTATVTLSYLAGGFDWQADYVVMLRRGAERADIDAWVTLASSDVTSFVDAKTQLVAGKPNREEEPDFGNFGGGALNLRCWPSNISYGRYAPPPAPPPPPPPAPMAMMAEDIVVTAQRRTGAMESAVAVTVVQGELGDFKLYTVPMPTTVASKAQKQVALATRTGVAVRTVYVSDTDDGLEAVHPVLRLRNRKADGLGLPLPAGKVLVFQEGRDRPILLGEPSLDDKAVDEEVELDLPATPGVSVTDEYLDSSKRIEHSQLTVSNANPWPIAYEARFPAGDPRYVVKDKTFLKNGKRVWAVTVPANGTATLRYSTRESD